MSAAPPDEADSISHLKAVARRAHPTLGAIYSLIDSDLLPEGIATADPAVPLGDGSVPQPSSEPPFDPLDSGDSLRLQAYATQLGDLIQAIRDGRDPAILIVLSSSVREPVEDREDLVEHADDTLNT